MRPKSVGHSNPLSSVISSFVAILDIYIIFYMYTYNQNGELGDIWIYIWVIFQHILYIDRRIDR